MDCMQACEIISAAHDGELVDAALLAQAREHAHACAECAAFVRTLDRIAAVPGPEAPPELVARIGDRVSAERHRAVGLPHTPVPTTPTPRPTHDRHAWIPRFAALASAAAVLLVVLSAGGIALLSRSGQTADETSVKQADGDEVLMAAPVAETAEDATSRVAGSAAPAFVSLDTTVWTLAGSSESTVPPLTSAGSVITSLDGGVASSRLALHPYDDRSLLYVTAEDGGYLVFSRVIRTLGGTEYGLVTGTPLDAFGIWPTLPGPSPERADGSPVFESAGYDDLGIEVFTRPGGSTNDGFAIAPATAPDDPAAGNPSWTWWEPLP